MKGTRVLGSLFAVALWAAGAGGFAQDPDVPLYTNEDLERFGPPSTSTSTPSADEVDRQWDFVQDHLEREYTRLDTERRLDLERSLAEPDPYDDAGIRYPVYRGGGPFVGYPYAGTGRGYDRVRDNFLLRYDQRTARHGYLVPRESARPSPRSGGGHKGRGAAGGGSPGRSGGRGNGNRR